MSSEFGKNIKCTIFGQSHSEAMGVVIDGLPPGEIVDENRIREFMARRAPGRTPWSTSRKEADLPRIVSGVFMGKTCGAPLTAIIENTNTRSKDYEKTKDIPRPSHADYPAHIRYNGFEDYRGGGHFSGRLTAPLCFAGHSARIFWQNGAFLSAVTLLPSAAFKISPLTPFPSPERNWNFLQKWNSPSTIPMSVIP